MGVVKIMLYLNKEFRINQILFPRSIKFFITEKKNNYN